MPLKDPIPPKPKYRFSVGTDVLCYFGDEGWKKGRITALDWRESDWPPGKTAPYQVDLGRGHLIFVPADVPELSRRFEQPKWAEAVAREDLKKLKAATKRDCNEGDDFGLTPLLACLGNGWEEGASFLVTQGADVNIRAGPQKTAPLHVAVMPLSCVNFQDTDNDIVEFARDEGVISAKLEKPGTPSEDIEDARVTSISYDQETMKLTWVGNEDEGESWSLLTPAMHTWIPGRIATLVQGTDVKTSGLPKAAGRMPIVKALLQARADVNAQNEDPDNDLDNFTSTTFNGLEQRQHRSALHYAAESGEAGLCGQLIAARADLALEDRFKMSPLDLALQGGSKLVVDILLRKGADPNRGNMSRGLQQTCLHQVSDLGQTEFVKLIVQYGGQVNSVGKQGMTPLHLAARKKHIDVVEVLLKSGADVSILDKLGHTAGHYAKVNRSTELCEALADGLEVDDRIAILEKAKAEKERLQREQEETEALINGYR